MPSPAQYTDNLATALLVREHYAKQLVAENSDLLTRVPGMAAKVPFFPEEQQGLAVSFMPLQSGPSSPVDDRNSTGVTHPNLVSHLHL